MLGKELETDSELCLKPAGFGLFVFTKTKGIGMSMVLSKWIITPIQVGCKSPK